MTLEKITDIDLPSGYVRLALGQDMTIYAIDAIKQAISQELAQADGIELDLSKVEEIDSAGIQVLLALNKEFEFQHKTLTLLAVSEVVSQFIESYGLKEKLMPGGAS